MHSVVLLISLSLILLIPLSHVFAARAGAFYFDSALGTNSQCAKGEMSLDYNQAPAAETQVPIAESIISLCSAATNPLLCPDCPYDGPTFNTSSVTLNLYGTNGSGDFFTITVYDETTGNMIAESNGYIYTNFASSSCTLDSFTIPLATLNDPQNTIYSTHSYAAFIFYPSTQPNKTGTICTGGSSASNLVFNSSPLITPEFPIGTVISVLAPLASVGVYLIARSWIRGVIRANQLYGYTR